MAKERNQEKQETVKPGGSFVLTKEKSCVFGADPKNEHDGYLTKLGVEKGYYQLVALEHLERTEVPENAAIGIKIEPNSGLPEIFNLSKLHDVKVEYSFTYLEDEKRQMHTKTFSIGVPKAYDTSENDPKNGGFTIGRTLNQDIKKVKEYMAHKARGKNGRVRIFIIGNSHNTILSGDFGRTENTKGNDVKFQVNFRKKE